MTTRKYIAIEVAILSTLLLSLGANVRVTGIGTSGTGLEGLEPVAITEIRSDGTHPMSNFSATVGVWMRPMFDAGTYFIPVDKHIVLEYNIPDGMFPNGFVLAMKAFSVTNNPGLDISIIWNGTGLDNLEHPDVTAANFSRNVTYFDGIEEDSLVLYVVNETINGTIGLLVAPAANCTDNNTARFPGIDGDLLYGTRPSLVPIQENAMNMTDAEWQAFIATVDEEVLGELVNFGSMDSMLGQLDALRDILSSGLFGMFGMGDQFDDAMDMNVSAETADFDLDFDFDIGPEFVPVLVIVLSGATILYIIIKKRKQITIRRY